MARAKKNQPPHDKKLTKVPTNGPTLKTVVLVWALCVTPSLLGAGYVIYERNPKPFLQAWAGAVWGAGKAQDAYESWQAGRAAAAAAEERKRKAAAAAAEAEAAAGF
jgi:hypothetical protein